MNHLFFVEECASTNDEIKNYISDEQNHSTAVFTYRQTEGRGQYGNSWQSLENLNIAFSLAIKAEAIITSYSLFNFYTAIVWRDFLANLSKTDVFVKWPNDIIMRNKKISGMLIEKKKFNSKNYFVIGIGINVLQTNFVNLPKAGSLLTETNIVFDLEDLATKMYFYFLENLKKPLSSEKIMEYYNNYLYKRDEVCVFQKEGLRQNGIIRKVDIDGCLWIDLENEGLKKFYHKEIMMLY